MWALTDDLVSHLISPERIASGVSHTSVIHGESRRGRTPLGAEKRGGTAYSWAT